MRGQEVMTYCLLIISILFTISAAQSFYSRRKFLPKPGANRFRLTSGRSSSKPLYFRGQYGNTESKARHSKTGRPGPRDTLTPILSGRTSALRAGEEGSYDFADQFNAIIPDRSQPKPLKKPEITTQNPNKINIETKIPAVTEPRTRVEKTTLGGTAILHCYFDAQAQVGDFRHSQIWWTKQPERAGDRPIILGAGVQIRIPDERLRIVKFDDDTFSILIIKQVLETDAGEYKCSLPTVAGTQTDFTKLMVYDPANENVVTSEKENIVEKGGDLTLFCNPEDTSLTVWWTAEAHTGETMEIVKSKSKVMGAELNLKRLGSSDAGVYTCHVQVGVGSPVTEQFNVYVKEKPWLITAFKGGFNVDTFLSKFSRDPEYGDEMNIRCDSGGIPTPAINWYKDNVKIEEAEKKYEIKTYNPTYEENAVISSLTILNFSPEDEGRYYCNSMNEMGQRQREFTLKGYYNVALPVQVANGGGSRLNVGHLFSDGAAPEELELGSGED